MAFGKSIGMGYVRPDLATPGVKMEVRMQDRIRPCAIFEDSPHDPTNALFRLDG